MLSRKKRKICGTRHIPKTDTGLTLISSAFKDAKEPLTRQIFQIFKPPDPLKLGWRWIKKTPVEI